MNVIGNIDPEKKLRYGFTSLDIALLESEKIEKPTPMNAHVIHLDGKYLSMYEFFHLFYSGNLSSFQLNDGLSRHPLYFFNQYTIRNRPFSLMEHIIKLYTYDYGKKLDICSLMKLQKQLFRYRSLQDISFLNVCTSMKSIIKKIASNANKKQLASCLFSNHLMILYIRFRNSHPSIKDVIIKFHFIVNFDKNQNNTIQGNIPCFDKIYKIPLVSTKLSIAYINEQLNGALDDAIEHYINPYCENKYHLINKDLCLYLDIVNTLKKIQDTHEIAGIIVKFIEAIYENICLQRKNIQLELQAKYSQDKLQEFIDGICKPEETVKGGEGQMRFEVKRNLSPFFSAYIRLCGMPSKDNPFDTFKAEEIKKFLENK